MNFEMGFYFIEYIVVIIAIIIITITILIFQDLKIIFLLGFGSLCFVCLFVSEIPQHHFLLFIFFTNTFFFFKTKGFEQFVALQK